MNRIMAILEGGIRLEKVGDIAVVSFVEDDSKAKLEYGTIPFEHRINLVMIDSMNEVLGMILDDETFRAVIVTGKGRYFCNGLDLQFISSMMEKDGNIGRTIQVETEKLLARLLTFPLPTVAALNGHCCAAGAMLALAFDYRVCVRTLNRNPLLFIPGLDIGLVYSEGMTELIKAKTSSVLFRDLVVFAKRFELHELSKHGMIDKVVAVEDSDKKDELLVSSTIDFIQSDLFLKDKFKNARFGSPKYRSTLEKIKKVAYNRAFIALSSGPSEDNDMGFNKGTWGKDGRIKYDKPSGKL